MTLFIGIGSDKLGCMKKHFQTLAILVFSGFITLQEARAREELTVIQTVSKNRRSFVVGKGLKDGLIKGQEIIFANENVSIVCKASLVSRDFSLWVPIDQTITVPFNKEDIVSANSTVYGNVALEIVGSEELTPPPEKDQDYKDFIKSNNFAIKAGYNRGLSQSSSDVSKDKELARTGYSFSLDYNYRFMPEFEMSAGIRIDNEVFRISEPELDIPTTRQMAIFSATYHFMNLSKNRNNFYLTIAAGLGKSTTTVSEEKATGSVTLLPEARLGYLMPLSKSKAILVEGSIESLSTNEEFSDGIKQTNNSRNFKFSVGLRF